MLMKHRKLLHIKLLIYVNFPTSHNKVDVSIFATSHKNIPSSINSSIKESKSIQKDPTCYLKQIFYLIIVMELYKF